MCNDSKYQSSQSKLEELNNVLMASRLYSLWQEETSRYKRSSSEEPLHAGL